jgi:hypothetical protein
MFIKDVRENIFIINTFRCSFDVYLKYSMLLFEENHKIIKWKKLFIKQLFPIPMHYILFHKKLRIFIHVQLFCVVQVINTFCKTKS